MGLKKLRQRVNRQSPHGKLNWQMGVSEELGLESTLRLRGSLSPFYFRFNVLEPKALSQKFHLIPTWPYLIFLCARH
jgi:hypothetical protein